MAAKTTKPKVTIYSTPTCHWCMKTKEFLKQHKIPFEDVNVATDLKARQEMIQKSGQMGVPVIEIGDTILVGFDEEALKEALDL